MDRYTDPIKLLGEGTFGVVYLHEKIDTPGEKVRVVAANLSNPFR